MPSVTKRIPYLELSEIDFTAPKHRTASSPAAVITHTATAQTISPTQPEIEDFFHAIAKEEHKKPVILSVIKPYSNNFVISNDHLPKSLQELFQPEYLESSYLQLKTVAESKLPEILQVTPTMADHVSHITQTQAKSKHWFHYRAGRITASRFRQVLHTKCYQPSLSLLKSVCYPDIYKFSNPAITWGCDHE